MENKQGSYFRRQKFKQTGCALSEVGSKPIRGRGPAQFSDRFLSTPGSVLEEVVDLGVERAVEVGDHVLGPLITQFTVVLTPSCVVSGFVAKVGSVAKLGRSSNSVCVRAALLKKIVAALQKSARYGSSATELGLPKDTYTSSQSAVGFSMSEGKSYVLFSSNS